MELKQNSWLEDFDTAQQDIMEDAFLLNALSAYMSASGEFTHREREEYFLQVLHRLCDYLSQHAMDLHQLEKRIKG